MMVDGCLFYLTCSYVLILLVRLHDVEASCCRNVINKKVGDTVELSPGPTSNAFTSAIWKYGESIIADKDRKVYGKGFKDRLYLNTTNFTLKLRDLTPQDSGKFIFISAGENGLQRETVEIMLKVHAPVTKKPFLTYKVSHTSNNSCSVSLECSADPNSSVSYTWTVRNRTSNGARLHYIIRTQDEETEFSCTAHHVVSEMSASRLVTCSNKTHKKSVQKSPVNFVTPLVAAGVGCLLVTCVVGIVVLFFRRRKSQQGSDTDDPNLYEEISQVPVQELQVVYDMVQFNR